MANSIDIISPIISVHPGDINLELTENVYDFPYKIINIVALGILTLPPNQTINFEELETKIQLKRINRFPCIMFKLENLSVILFKNGKMILTGIKNKEEIPYLHNKIAMYLQEHELEFLNLEIKIQNLVAMTQLNKQINLELINLALTNCIYEPEQFPAAIIKPNSGGAFLVFSNSKIICLGMRNLEALEDALRNLIQNIFENDLFIDIPLFDENEIEIM